MRMSGSTFVSLHECYRGPEPGFDRKIRFFNAYQSKFPYVRIAVSGLLSLVLLAETP